MLNDHKNKNKIIAITNTIYSGNDPFTIKCCQLDGKKYNV